MTVRSVEGFYTSRMTQNGQKKKDGPVSGFSMGLEGREKEESGKQVEKRQVNVTDVFASRRVTAAACVKGTERTGSAVLEKAEVRDISYAQSDSVVVDVLGGCTMKTQVDVSGRSVYVEVKTEEGDVYAYEADPFHISAHTDNPIEKLALESWHKAAAKQAASETEKPDTAGQKAENSSETENTENGAAVSLPGAEKAERYQYHPQYISEMSNEEWEQLLKKTDRGIAEGKEVSRQHKEEQEEKARQDRIERTSLRELVNDAGGRYVPYSYLADEYGIVEYNGVAFVCDYESGALCLGDMSNKKNVLTIPLSKGGCLKVNRDNIGQLSAAIGMFSPEDVNLILRAIAQDAKLKKAEQELEEDKQSIGESATEHLDGEDNVL